LGENPAGGFATNKLTNLNSSDFIAFTTRLLQQQGKRAAVYA